MSDASERYSLSADEQSLLDHADQFSRNALHPLAERMDREEWWPPEVFAQVAEMGYFGITVPEIYGGCGASLTTCAIVLQAFSRWNHAFALSWGAHENLCLNNIYRNATDEQRERFLPGLCNGTKVGALGLTEPGAGSDALGSMRTTARKDGDHYVINGSKMYITNGPIADVVLVYAKTAPDLGPKGISAFVVEKGTPGFSVAQSLTKMGYRGSPTGELLFQDCRVPAENLIGEENHGVSVVMSGLDIERALLSTIALGIAERALDLSLEYATTRQQFQRPIASFQMVQSMLAEMYVAIESSRTFIYRVVSACEDMEKGAGGRGEIHKLSAAAIMHAAESCHKVLNYAVQIHGGAGYIWETEINRLYRSLKLMEIGAGTTEVRKLIISEELLKHGV